MKKLINYFHPSKEVSYFENLKTNFYIIFILTIIPIICIFAIVELQNPNDNFKLQLYPKIGVIIFLIISLFIVKFKGI